MSAKTEHSSETWHWSPAPTGTSSGWRDHLWDQRNCSGLELSVSTSPHWLHRLQKKIRKLHLCFFTEHSSVELWRSSLKFYTSRTLENTDPLSLSPLLLPPFMQKPPATHAYFCPWKADIWQTHGMWRGHGLDGGTCTVCLSDGNTGKEAERTESSQHMWPKCSLED